jgi:hypothetical protein
MPAFLVVIFSVIIIPKLRRELRTIRKDRCLYVFNIFGTERSNVLKLALIDPTKAVILARIIESIYGHNSFCKVKLYNVDLLPAQSYFYEHDVFPGILAYLKTVH